MCNQYLGVVLSGLLSGSQWQKPTRALAGNAWEEETSHRPGSRELSLGRRGTKQGKHHGRGPVRSVSRQAAMLLTLLWVTGHKPEKESVYHVGIRAILDSPQ